MLRDGVYELRTKVGKVNYRILYGFVGSNIALLAAGLTKEKKVPSKEIEQALACIAKYKENPAAHSFSFEEGDENG